MERIMKGQQEDVVVPVRIEFVPKGRSEGAVRKSLRAALKQGRIRIKDKEEERLTVLRLLYAAELLDLGWYDRIFIEVVGEEVVQVGASNGGKAPDRVTFGSHLM
jgi:hypothetical protein